MGVLKGVEIILMMVVNRIDIVKVIVLIFIFLVILVSVFKVRG